MNKYDFVKKHPMNIAFYKNPPKSLQVIAVRGNEDALRYIKDPHPDTWAQYFKNKKCRGSVDEGTFVQTLKKFPKHRFSIIRGAAEYSGGIHLEYLKLDRETVEFFLKNRNLLRVCSSDMGELAKFLTDEEKLELFNSDKDSYTYRHISLYMNREQRETKKVKEVVMDLIERQGSALFRIENPTTEEIKHYYMNSADWSRSDRVVETLKKYGVSKQQQEEWQCEMVQQRPQDFWKSVDRGMDTTIEILQLAWPALKEELERIKQEEGQNHYGVESDFSCRYRCRGDHFFNNSITETTVRFLSKVAPEQLRKDYNIPTDVVWRLVEDDPAKIVFIDKSELDKPEVVETFLEAFHSTDNLKVKHGLAERMVGHENDDYRVVEMICEIFPGRAPEYKILTKKMILQHLKKDYVAEMLAQPKGKQMLRNMMEHIKESDRKEVEEATQ